MDFEELIGALFVLYILGSMVAGFFRRAGQRRTPGDPARPRLPDLLDMDELERRLRELATGQREADTKDAAAVAPPVETVPSPAAQAGVPRSMSSSVPFPAAKGSPAAEPSPSPFDGTWDEWPERMWSEQPAAGPTRRVSTLPPVVASYIEGGHPWQAAFVVKELLGPPKFLRVRRMKPGP